MAETPETKFTRPDKVVVITDTKICPAGVTGHLEHMFLDPVDAVSIEVGGVKHTYYHCPCCNGVTPPLPQPVLDAIDAEIEADAEMCAKDIELDALMACYD